MMLSQDRLGDRDPTNELKRIHISRPPQIEPTLGYELLIFPADNLCDAALVSNCSVREVDSLGCRLICARRRS